MRVWPGSPYPLGATWDGEGVNFALFSEHATGVELCLFDRADDAREAARISARRARRLRVARLSARRAPRASSTATACTVPTRPRQGHRFNPAKLLIDPYARAISRPDPLDRRAVSGHRSDDPSGDLVASRPDSAAVMPKCVVIEPAFTWGDDRPPRTPWSRTVIYECHVRGLTKLPSRRARAAARHLPRARPWTPSSSTCVALGVTAVELLPVHHFVADRLLVERGLTNYWGYNSIGFFAPDVRYAAGAPGEQVPSSRRW